MIAVTPSELTSRFPAILGHLAAGESIVVREEGIELARIVKPDRLLPLPPLSDEELAAANARILKHVIRTVPSGGLDNESIDRDLGRAYCSESDEP